jgi:hypothetical protein
MAQLTDTAAAMRQRAEIGTKHHHPKETTPMTRFRKLTLAAFLALTAVAGAAIYAAPAHAFGKGGTGSSGGNGGSGVLFGKGGNGGSVVFSPSSASRGHDFHRGGGGQSFHRGGRGR